MAHEGTSPEDVKEEDDSGHDKAGVTPWPFANRLIFTKDSKENR
jgi:hypothetical protein